VGLALPTPSPYDVVSCPWARQAGAKILWPLQSHGVHWRGGLPPRAKIHDVFHVGLLKAFHGLPPVAPVPLPLLHHGRVYREPAAVLKCQHACGQQEVLVQWKGTPAAETSWMNVDDFCQVYPAFQLEDELLAQVGRDLMVGNTYSHRRNRQAEKQGKTTDSVGGTRD
jgi:hypothetical protein